MRRVIEFSALSMLVFACSSSELPPTYEYLKARTFDADEREVVGAGFLAASVFIPLGFGWHPPKWFKPGTGRCADLLSRVSAEHVQLAYAAYRAENDSHSLGTIELQCVLFRGYDDACVKRVEESVRAAVDQIAARDPSKAAAAEMLGSVTAQQKKSAECAIREPASASRRYVLR